MDDRLQSGREGASLLTLRDIARGIRHHLRSMEERRAESLTDGKYQQLVDGDWTWWIYPEVVSLAKYTGQDPEPVMPDHVGGKPVIRIMRSAFVGNSVVQKLTVPETVMHIGGGAFQSMEKLEELHLPGALDRIRPRTFAECPNLHTVTLPYALKALGSEAFSGCPKLTSLPHPVAVGPKKNKHVSSKRVERNLPETLRTIGDRAFENCLSLKRVVIPYRVTRIPNLAFVGCSSLKQVWLHSGITSIGDRAFGSCWSLKVLRVPETVQEIGRNAFPTITTLVCPEGSVVHEYALDHKIAWRSGTLPAETLTARFGQDNSGLDRVLGSWRELRGVVDEYEVRPPLLQLRAKNEAPTAGRAAESRFTLDGDTYRSKAATGDEARILVTGDLICGGRMDRSAMRGGIYDFSDCFEYVSDTLRASDLTLGNLGTVFSHSYPTSRQRMHADGRPNFNAPVAYADAIRNAGFDAVMGAHDHMYDAGVRGLFETLTALNTSNLIHGGAYASAEEPRFTLFELNGITVGVVAFLDPTRMRMRQANLTPVGLKAVSSRLDEQNVRDTISAAKDAGAEFVLAFCHWGNTYAEKVSRSQSAYARMVVEAGADYVFGSHPRRPQRRGSLPGTDGWKVPVVYSGGYFLSDMTGGAPSGQDTFIGGLVLRRGDGGRVRIKEDFYIPARVIETTEVRGRFSVVPLDLLDQGALGYDPSAARLDRERIAAFLGPQYRMRTLSELAAWSDTTD